MVFTMQRRFRRALETEYLFRYRPLTRSYRYRIHTLLLLTKAAKHCYNVLQRLRLFDYFIVEDFMKDVEQEAREFWAKKEEEKGGRVKFYTFATYMGRWSDRSVALGGLVYIVKNNIYFEDFEKENWILRVVQRKSKYEKTEFSIDIDDISETKITSRNSALNCIEGFVEPGNTKTLAPLMKLLAKPVVQINLKNGSALFFEIMKAGEFINSLHTV